MPNLFGGTRTAILQALIGRELFGLEIADRIEKMTGERPSTGSLYPELRELEAEGLLESGAGETTEARRGRPRIYYRLTALGERKAQEQRVQAASLFTLKLPVGAR